MKKHIKISFITLYLVVQIFIFPDLTVAQKILYDIYSKDKKIGSITIQLSDVAFNDTTVLKVETNTEIKVKTLFISLFSLDSQEESLINEAGTFHYNSISVTNGDTIIINGNLREDEFLFDIIEGKKKQCISIKRNQYDFTSQDSPETLLEIQGKVEVFRILDFDKLAVVTQELKWIRNDELYLDGEIINCKVIEFISANKKGMRWITKDKYGLLIEEQGEDEDGKYSIKISRFREISKN